MGVECPWMRPLALSLLLFAPCLPSTAADSPAAAWTASKSGAEAAKPEDAATWALRAFDRPPSPTPVHEPDRLNRTASSRPLYSYSAARPALTARVPGIGRREAAGKGYLSRLFDWAVGLVKLPLMGTVHILENLFSVPFQMAEGLKEGNAKALLYPLKGVVDACWNAMTLAVAEANHASAPLYWLFDPGQGPAEVKDDSGLLWTSGGPAGGILHALKRRRFRFFMPSQVVVFGDQRQIDCDCNPVNPDDPYDNNAVNALHEVILKDKYPVGYATDFAAPWAFSPSFRHREEEAALQDAIRRLYPGEPKP